MKNFTENYTTREIAGVIAFIVFAIGALFTIGGHIYLLLK